MPAHAALITVLILDRPMCPECIAEKANMTVAAVEDYLEQIGVAVAVQERPNERCRTCGTIGHAISIGRN